MQRHVWVSGRVQGVWFRQTCAEQARSAGVTGWVRNLPDGRVEAVFEGEQGEVRALVEWCRSGPAHATVEHVEVDWEAFSGDFSGFQVL